MDLADLKDWAIDNEVQPSVLKFIKAYGQLSQHGVIYGPLAAWKRVSEVLDRELETIDRDAAIAQIIGDVGAIHFSQFLTIDNRETNVDSILSGDMLTLNQSDVPSLRNDPEAAQRLGTALNYALADRIAYIKSSWQAYVLSDAYTEWVKQADNALEFCLQNFSPEMTVLFVRGMISAHQLPLDIVRMPAWATFSTRYKEFITSPD